MFAPGAIGIVTAIEDAIGINGAVTMIAIVIAHAVARTELRKASAMQLLASRAGTLAAVSIDAMLMYRADSMASGRRGPHRLRLREHLLQPQRSRKPRREPLARRPTQRDRIVVIVVIAAIVAADAAVGDEVGAVVERANSKAEAAVQRSPQRPLVTSLPVARRPPIARANLRNPSGGRNLQARRLDLRLRVVRTPHPRSLRRPLRQHLHLHPPLQSRSIAKHQEHTLCGPRVLRRGHRGLPAADQTTDASDFFSATASMRWRLLACGVYRRRVRPSTSSINPVDACSSKSSTSSNP